MPPLLGRLFSRTVLATYTVAGSRRAALSANGNPQSTTRRLPAATAYRPYHRERQPPYAASSRSRATASAARSSRPARVRNAASCVGRGNASLPTSQRVSCRVLNSLPQFAAAFAAAVGLMLLARAARRCGPLAVTASGGRIAIARPAVWLIAFGALFFGGMGILGLAWGWATDDLASLIMAPIFLAAAVACAWFVSISSSPSWQVSWDESGVSGPSTQASLRRHPEGAIMPWSGVTRFTVDRAGCRTLASDSGTRVVWGSLYGGHDVFERAIAAHCPHLAADIDAA